MQSWRISGPDRQWFQQAWPDVAVDAAMCHVTAMSSYTLCSTSQRLINGCPLAHIDLEHCFLRDRALVVRLKADESEAGELGQMSTLRLKLHFPCHHHHQDRTGTISACAPNNRC